MNDTSVHKGDSNSALSDDTLAVARFFCFLLRGKWIILFSVLVVTVIAALLAWNMPPIYRSQVLLAHVDEEGEGASGLSGQLSSLVSLPGVSFGQGGSSKEEVIALLGSRNLSQEFIVQNDLLPEIFPGRWNAKTSSWKNVEGQDVPTFGQAFKVFDQDMRRVNVDKTTGLISVAIDHPQRERAAFWANTLVSHANKRIRSSAIEEANRSITYLQTELTKTNVAELQQAIYRLIEAQLQKIMLANVRQEYSFKVLDPAVVADEDDFIRPNRILMLVLGGFLGGFLGVFIVIVRQAFSQLRASEF